MYVKQLALCLVRVGPQHMDTIILPILANLPGSLSAVAIRKIQGMRLICLEPIKLQKCLFEVNLFSLTLEGCRGFCFTSNNGGLRQTFLLQINLNNFTSVPEVLQSNKLRIIYRCYDGKCPQSGNAFWIMQVFLKYAQNLNRWTGDISWKIKGTKVRQCKICLAWLEQKL